MPTKKDKLSNLVFRPDAIKGNPDDLVNISWSYNAKKGKVGRHKPLAVKEDQSNEEIIHALEIVVSYTKSLAK